jgi:uncharacterized membrane protein YjfL (UPF0719 family)
MSTWLDPIMLNFVYAGVGGIMLIVFTWLASRLFSNVMGFKIREQLEKGNMAVGLAMMGIFIGMGIGMGLVIGLGMN